MSAANDLPPRTWRGWWQHKNFVSSRIQDVGSAVLCVAVWMNCALIGISGCSQSSEIPVGGVSNLKEAMAIKTANTAAAPVPMSLHIEIPERIVLGESAIMRMAILNPGTESVMIEFRSDARDFAIQLKDSNGNVVKPTSLGTMTMPPGPEEDDVFSMRGGVIEPGQSFAREIDLNQCFPLSRGTYHVTARFEGTIYRLRANATEPRSEVAGIERVASTDDHVFKVVEPAEAR